MQRYYTRKSLNNIIIPFFESGDMASQIVKDIQSAGGFITLTDLSGYRAIERGPLRTKIKDLEMLSTPPPGSGALISLALKIMSGMCMILFSIATSGCQFSSSFSDL